LIQSAIRTLIELCTRRPWLVVAASVLITAGASVYSVRHFAINTDITRLISPDLPWRQRELAFSATFPHGKETIIAVVDAPTSEGASNAARALADALAGRKDLFTSVDAGGEEPFFAHAALLYLPTRDVAATVGRLERAAPLVRELTSDPSLRGLSQALSFGLSTAQPGAAGLQPLARVFDQAAAAVEAVLAGRPAFFSWRELVSGQPPTTSELRRFVEIQPVLDFSALEPGKKASEAVRRTVSELKLGERFGARVRLTGSVPIADEEFSTIADGAVPSLLATVAIVLVILWLALRSARIIVAVFATVAVGLAVTAAAGLMLVGALNLISVAFAVLFVGIGVDFGIQFSVRYRAERHEVDDLKAALSNAGEHIAVPLALAAAATAAGFLSFVPTAYRGVSELGQIAGLGMIVAFLGSITVLPALLVILNPRGESEPLGYAALAPIDGFMERYRMPILIGSAAAVIAASPLLLSLQFDFNPIDLRNPNTESISTYLDVRGDPTVGANAVDVLADSQRDAAQVAERLGKVPEVSSVRTLASFVPSDQTEKLAVIEAAGRALLPALDAARRPAPSDKDNVDALKRAQQALDRAAANRTGEGSAAAVRLAAALGRLVAASPQLRERVQAAFVGPLQVAVDGLRSALHPQPVTEQTLPPRLKRQWLAADGRARVEVLPKDALKDNAEIHAFARAVKNVEPRATGGPIAILESGRTIIRAFFEAGLWALVSIAVLLWLTLRRFGDVMLTLIPLVVAGVVTLELCVVFGLTLNFANIIALPLLLGIGVAFKIYYVMAWRGGQSQVLQSPLTRAVFFSALTTATAFGSLWFSSHPGTSSMGKLLALSLVCTLAAAVLFQPVLMGPPREVARVRRRKAGPRARAAAKVGVRAVAAREREPEQCE
jgi:hopanoid biosynthesis associated RND transporter like protein HpnN